MKHSSLPQLVRSHARKYGPKPALWPMERGPLAEFTWTDLWTAAWNLARDLVDAGFPHEGCGIVAAGDGPEAVAAEVAIQAAGGVALHVAPPVDPEGLAALLRETRAALLCFAESEVARAIEARSRVNTPILERTLVRLQPLPPDAPAPEEPDALRDRLSRVGPLTPAALVCSGGRTGPRKLCAWKHENLVDAGAAVAARLKATEADTWLVLGPLGHPFLRMTGLYAPLVSGGCVALPPAQRPLEALWLARPAVVTCLAGEVAGLRSRIAAEIGSAPGVQGRFARWILGDPAAPQPRGLAGAARRAIRWLASSAGPAVVRDVVGGNLRCVLAGWGVADPEAVAAFDALGVAVCGSYGLAEAGGVVTLERPGERGEDGRCGGPLDGVRMRVTPAGELEVSGAGVMFSYHDLSPRVNPAFADGWLRTGDRGEIGTDGALRLLGRMRGDHG